MKRSVPILAALGFFAATAFFAWAGFPDPCGRVSADVPASGAPATEPAATTADAQPGLVIEVFGMGQADAMLVAGPSASLLVDCGAPIEGPKDGYLHVAREIEKRVGRRHVDDLLITHFHSDHTGEAPDHDHVASGIWGLFAEGVTVTSILDHGDHYPSFGAESHPHTQFMAALPEWKREGKFLNRKTPHVGERIELGGRAFARVVAVNGNGVLEHAAKAGRFHDANPSENDYSIALVLELGSFEMYSGGDLGGEDTSAHTGGRGGHKKHHEVYDDVESAIRKSVGNIEVLRVDHHGSPHSTNLDFVTTLRPEVSIISCGEHNNYHHPSLDVVDRLSAFGPVFVTSGLSGDWSGRAGAPKVEGDITIAVSKDGAQYVVTGRDGELWRGRSFSDEEEARGLDHPKRLPK